MQSELTIATKKVNLILQPSKIFSSKVLFFFNNKCFIDKISSDRALVGNAKEKIATFALVTF